MKRVVVYGRQGCCLCDEALLVLKRLRLRHPRGFSLHYADIESDEALLRRYLERIPVIEIDGAEAFELTVEEPELELRLGIVRTG
jgi:glutaredoxin